MQDIDARPKDCELAAALCCGVYALWAPHCPLAAAVSSPRKDRKASSVSLYNFLTILVGFYLFFFFGWCYGFMQEEIYKAETTIWTLQVRKNIGRVAQAVFPGIVSG